MNLPDIHFLFTFLFTWSPICMQSKVKSFAVRDLISLFFPVFYFSVPVHFPTWRDYTFYNMYFFSMNGWHYKNEYEVTAWPDVRRFSLSSHNTIVMLIYCACVYIFSKTSHSTLMSVFFISFPWKFNILFWNLNQYTGSDVQMSSFISW